MSRVLPIDVDAYKAKMQGELDALRKHMLGGGCASFEEYRKKTGEINGLLKAERLFMETLKKDFEDDDG